jgi:hypothetical protein
MKFRNLIFSSMVVTFLGSCAIINAEVTVSASFKVNAFDHFSELNDYGEWVMVPGYGTVWRPDAGPDWRPFQYGHWVYSNEGWVWDSDEPFGWIVCHYGNWFYDDVQGWVWLPGNTWSPARVKWYVTDNEIGWEPLFPEHRPGHHWDKVHMQWTFCPVQFFTEVEVRNHVSFHAKPNSGEAGIHVYVGPPRREFVQRVAPRPIVSISLNKALVTTNNRSLVRVEIGNRERPHVEVPIGPMYKRATVRSDVPESRTTVHVNHEERGQPAVVHEKTDNPRVIVQPQSNQAERKVRVEVQSRRQDKENVDNNQDNNRDNSHNDRERAR